MRLAHAVVLGSLLFAGVPAAAQTHGAHQTPGHSGPPLPYAGFERRAIKALSEQQVSDLRAGRGMGLALAAELNGCPGPLHVLELADALGLLPEARGRAEALTREMKAETIAIGERVIAEEAALDRLFAERRATPTNLAEATARIAATQGDLRAAHLRYHVAMRDLLSPDQVDRYNQRRGYQAK